MFVLKEYFYKKYCKKMNLSLILGSNFEDLERAEKILSLVTQNIQ